MPQGNRLPGTEVVRFANGAFEHVAVFRNPQFDDGGWGEPTHQAGARVGPEASTTPIWKKMPKSPFPGSSALPTYDVRGKSDLGETAKVNCGSTPGARWC